MTDAETRVFVVDDDAAMREALDSLLRSVGLQVESFASAGEFMQYDRAETTSCVVLDVRLPGTSGLELQHELRAAGACPPIIFITGHGDVQMGVQAMKAGATDFLQKPFRDQDLLDAIYDALDADRRARAHRAGLEALRRRHDTLSERERQVFVSIVSGMMNKQIALDLGLAESTVKIHRRRIMLKMQAASLPALVRMADRLHILPKE
jgi:FixJ family two-component response regulator